MLTYEAPPSRDRLPTLPEDLSEYARIHTGPPSQPPPHDESLDEITAGRLVDLWHSDIPCMVSPSTNVANQREFRLMTLIDGRATVGTLLEASGMPLSDMLESLCELCARGVIVLDRSARLAR
jgi:hypothetical protein